MTHKWGSQTIVGCRDERSIEVIQVDLAPGLELMDKIKELECEGSARARPGSGKPSDTKELDATVARLYTVVVAKAISNPHCMRSRNIEEREGNGRRRKDAWIAGVVAKLIGQPQVVQSLVNEEVTVPPLW